MFYLKLRSHRSWASNQKKKVLRCDTDFRHFQNLSDNSQISVMEFVKVSGKRITKRCVTIYIQQASLVPYWHNHQEEKQEDIFYFIIII